MSNMNPAYDKILLQVEKTHGAHTALVVKEVIYLKHNQAEFQQIVENLNIDPGLRQELIRLTVDSIAEAISAMCVLIGKQFRTDIMSLVNSVTKEITEDGRHLQ